MDSHGSSPVSETAQSVVTYVYNQHKTYPTHFNIVPCVSNSEVIELCQENFPNLPCTMCIQRVDYSHQMKVGAVTVFFFHSILGKSNNGNGFYTCQRPNGNTCLWYISWNTMHTSENSNHRPETTVIRSECLWARKFAFQHISTPFQLTIVSIGHISFVSRTHPPSFSAHLIRNITSSTHSRRNIFELSSLSTILTSKPSQTFENSFYTLRSSLSSPFRIRISSSDSPTHSSHATFDVSCVFQTCYHMQV